MSRGGEGSGLTTVLMRGIVGYVAVGAFDVGGFVLLQVGGFGVLVSCLFQEFFEVHAVEYGQAAEDVYAGIA